MRPTKENKLKLEKKLSEANSEEIKRIVNLCFKNVQSYLDDIHVLKTAGNYDHIFSFITMGMEEYGKGMIFMEFYLEKKIGLPIGYQDNEKSISDKFFNHLDKYNVALQGILAAAIPTDLSEENRKIEVEKQRSILTFAKSEKINDLIFKKRNHNLYIDLELSNDELMIAAPLTLLKPMTQNDIETIDRLCEELQTALDGSTRGLKSLP